MKLKKELTYDKGASFALAWAFTWRWIILVLVMSIPEYLIKSFINYYEYSWVLMLLEFVLLVLAMFLVVYHVLNKGFARIKIVIMEVGDYEKMFNERL